MPDPELVLVGRRVVTPEGVRPAAVVVREGRIAALLPPEDAPDGVRRVDAGEAAVLPAAVDLHVHVNEPGRTEWEGFETAGAAAAAGGIATIVDMPLNSSPVTTTVAAFEAKLAAARGTCAVDFGLWGGLVPDNVDRLEPLFEAGVLGFKCFLVDSGIEEFPPVEEPSLRAAMPILARLGAPLLAHAELSGPIERACSELTARALATREAAGFDHRADHGPGTAGRSYARYLASRPPAAEVEAVELLVRLSEETGCRIHIVHLSAAEALEPIARARAAGAPVTCETCPHYLMFAAEEIRDGATAFKCAPPIREAANRERLWEALGDGRIDLVASDHSPCPPELKRLEEGDFSKAWGGIASLQLLLAATWTEARRRGHGLEALAGWVCERPARFAGLADRKGRIEPGLDADLIVWDPEARFAVEPEALHHRHPVTPYEGRELRGRVEHAFVRGVPVVGRGELATERPGRWVRRR